MLITFYPKATGFRRRATGLILLGLEVAAAVREGVGRRQRASSSVASFAALSASVSAKT